jgi:protein ImuA
VQFRRSTGGSAPPGNDNPAASRTYSKSVPRSAFVQRNRTAGGAGARSGLIERLRERIRAIERAPVSLAAPPMVDTGRAPHPACNPLSAWTFGIEEIDTALPGGGLDPGGLHEILPRRHPDSWAALGFALALIARRGAAEGESSAILWCFTDHAAREFGAPYAPGLVRFGIDPAALVMARVQRIADLAWALEEGLKSRALCAVLGQGNALPARLVRRLSLAARTYHTPCLLISDHRAGGAGPALTRWRVSAMPSARPVFDASAPGNPCWRIALERCRHGLQGREWILEYDHETHRFRLAAPLADRAADGGGAGARRRLAAG